MAQQSFLIDRGTAQRLGELSDRAGTTPPTAWIAIVAVLIHRYTGRDDVVLDLLPNTRVNVRVAGDPTFDELLRQTVASAPRLPADARISLIIQSDDDEAVLVPAITRAGSDPGTTRASLVLTVMPEADAVRGTLDYQARWLDAAIVARLRAHVGNIAAHVAGAPLVRVSQIEMFDADERKSLRTAMAGPSVGYASGPVHELFERVAAEKPDALALSYLGATMTFRELNEHANRLAHRLRAAGVGPEVPVGLCVRRSPSAVIGVFGILKSGGAYVPLDPAYPQDRLTDMLREAKPAAIVADRAGMSLFSTSSALCVDVDDAEAAARYSCENPCAGVSPDNAAYVVFTSGSTGRPKAIVLTHRSAANGLNRVPFHRDDPGEVSCLNSSLGVAFTTARLFLPLLCGLPLVIIPDGEERELTQLIRAWENAGVTNLAMVTPVLRQLLALGPNFTSRLQRVRTIAVGGDVMSPETMAAFAEALPGAMLIHGYASSEIGGAAIIHERVIKKEFDQVSIGQPFPNTQLYVMDPWLNVMPLGAIGEVCVSARHLARGYLNQAALTAERFVPNPVSDDGTRLYRTGDLGRVLPNGELELLGRVDDQIKLRGHRIDLRGIEAVLLQNEGVRGGAITVREVEGSKRLVAYVIKEPGSSITVSALREHLARRLPEHMVPSMFEFVEAFPLTPTGKVDRKALPAPRPDRPDIETPYKPPEIGIESEMAKLWTTLLGIDRIGVHDHFLDVGGDSFFVTELVVQVAQRFGVELRETAVFDRPTISALSQYVQESRSFGGEMRL